MEIFDGMVVGFTVGSGVGSFLLGIDDGSGMVVERMFWERFLGAGAGFSWAGWMGKPWMRSKWLW